jgi:Lrp/AsnC family transcriptional regulator for asnA, asnC and gidA
MKLDSIDIAILDALNDNARISNREVARSLGLSEALVRQRLKKMDEGKAMRLGLVANIASLGYDRGVILRLRTTPGCARAVARQIAALECCAFAGVTLGRFDVLAYLIAPSRLDLSVVIEHQITSMEGVVGIDVCEPIGSAKQRLDLISIA